MKCEQCGKDDAVIKITRIEKDGRAYQVCLCQSCAAEVSPYQKKAMEKQTSFDMLLKELLKQQKMESAQSGPGVAASVPPCPSCGLEYATYRATYMLGCPDCYDSFAEVLEPDLQRIHQATRHAAGEENVVSELVRIQERLQAMRDELSSAIEFEDYERAAYLRDEISKLEKKARKEDSAHKPDEEPEKGAS